MGKQQAYRKKAEAKLAEKRAEIDKVKAQVKGAGADAELEASDAITELEGKYERAKRRLRDVAEAGEDAWEDLTKGFEEAWDDVSSAVKKAFGRRA